MDRDDLRIGDAEREQTMAALREHFAQGRLTHEELDERLERALAARTGRDLTRITADLPGHDPAARHDAHDRRAARHDAYDWRKSIAAHHKQMQAMRLAHHELRRAQHQMRRQWPRRLARRHHRGPHPIVGVLFVLMVLGLLIGGSGIFKVLLAVWLGALVLSLVHRRFHARR
jgi:predicted DNA-binding protein